MTKKEKAFKRYLSISKFQENQYFRSDLRKMIFLYQEQNMLFVNDYTYYFLNRYGLEKYVDMRKDMYSIMKYLINEVFNHIDVRENVNSNYDIEVDHVLNQLYLAHNKVYIDRYNSIVSNLKHSNIDFYKLFSFATAIINFANDLFEHANLGNIDEFVGTIDRIQSISNIWRVFKEEEKYIDNIADEQLKKVIKLQLLDIVECERKLLENILTNCVVPKIELIIKERFHILNQFYSGLALSTSKA